LEAVIATILGKGVSSPSTVPTARLRSFGEIPLSHEEREIERLKDEVHNFKHGVTSESTQEPTIPKTVALPSTWDELRKRNSITEKEAAGYLRRSTKTVQRLVKAKELKQSTKKRIICDEHLRRGIRKVHGPHVLP
jgi:hypothetical protein